MDFGFHVLEEEVLEERDLPEFDRISVLGFARVVQEKELENYGEYRVVGLDVLLSRVEDRERVCDYLHEILRDRASYLINTYPTFQFPLRHGRIETWNDTPKIVTPEGEEVPLHLIFGSMSSPESHPKWFWHQRNVES